MHPHVHPGAVVGKKKKEASRIASKCPKNILKLASPIGASQQVSEVSQQLKVAVTRTKDELAQLQNDVTHLRTRAAAPFQTDKWLVVVDDGPLSLITDRQTIHVHFTLNFNNPHFTLTPSGASGNCGG